MSEKSKLEQYLSEMDGEHFEKTIEAVEAERKRRNPNAVVNARVGNMGSNEFEAWASEEIEKAERARNGQ